METCYEPGVVTENLRIVEEKIQNACKRSGRKREDVTLIAVSKTKPAAMIREAYDAGIRVFGENKVQELTDVHSHLNFSGDCCKMPLLIRTKEEIRWQNLQRKRFYRPLTI